VSDDLRHLLPHERDAIDEFVRRLPQILNRDPVGVWLFGSKARGNADLDSDIDLLVVVELAQPVARRRVWTLGADLSLEHDVLLNAHIIDAERWSDESRFRGTLWREIERDGIPLLVAAHPT
jgi:predicted nucleotidyltransferase